MSRSAPTEPSTPGTPQSAGTTSPARSARRPAVGTVVAAAVDVVCVLGFAAGGRASHEADAGLSTVLTIAWPFLVGLAIGWLVLRFWRRPLAVWPVGVGLWVSTWCLGMLLRAITGEGLAVTFLLVAAGFLGLTLVGWRIVVAGVNDVRSRSAASPR